MRLSRARSTRQAVEEMQKKVVSRTTDFREAVYAAVLRIPKGRVATYRDIAYAIGKPHAARAVGNALNRNPYAHVPCHRVVPRDGSVGGYAWGTHAKAARLRAEGVAVTGGRILLSRHRVRW